MVLPKQLIKAFQKDYFFYTQSVSRFDQDIVRKFIQEGYWEKHINKMRVVYKKKRDVLVSAMTSHFPKSVEIIGQDSGLHLLIRIHNGMSEQELIQEAAAYSVKVYAISEYGKTDNKTVLLGFASLSEDEIQNAVRLLAKAWFQ